mgnify:CR=1 FL=1
MTTIISLRCFLLLSVVVAVVHSCTVRGGSNFNNNIRISNGNIICDGTDACNNATISGCTTVTCADRDCTSATILDAETVNCEGINACYLATIGTATNPAGSVYCKGDEFTCYQSTIYANDTIVCGVDDGATAGDASEGSQNGACGFATLETPCLQCLGSNHGW